MSLKKGGGPETLAVTLTVVGQQSTDKIDIVYHNRKSSELQEQWEKPGMTLGGIIPFIVKEWSTDFPLTEEGMKDMEDEYPGMLDAIMAGYGVARRKEVVKN